MSKSKNSVGANQTFCQPTTTFKTDLFANGADTVFTAADIVAVAIAAGATFPDASAVVAGDFVHQIDIDLKPVAGEGRYWDGAAYADAVATASDAIYSENGGESNIDPQGSRCDAMTDEKGCPIANKFESVEVKDGSIVTVAITLVKGA